MKMLDCCSTISCPSLIRRLAGGRREPSLEPSREFQIRQLEVVVSDL
jgi:hypothetical protein